MVVAVRYSKLTLFYFANSILVMLKYFSKKILVRWIILSGIIFSGIESVEVFAQQGVPKLYIQLSDNHHIKDIVKETKMDAGMRIDNANGSNFPAVNLYNGQIRIKGRGNSSWSNSDKKSYSIDLIDRTGKKTDVPLLGMPKSADWILYASYFDKSFMRNHFAYELSRAMGHWASRCWYVELYVNGEYRGLYGVHENIRNEEQRAWVKEGGYIIEQDYPLRLKSEGVKYIASSRIYEGRWYGDAPVTDSLYFGFTYPSNDNLTALQKKYIRDYIADFETALYGSNFADLNTGYRQYIDVNSFADWYILSELGGDWDHRYFLSSCYLSKPQGEKMKFCPVWDFDVAFKTSLNYLSARNNVPWIRRMWEDESFRKLVFARCADILPLLENSISRIEEAAAELNRYGAIDRNFEKWDILGQAIWGEPSNVALHPIPKTYDGELRKLTQWIRQRYLYIATYDNGNYCDVLKQMKPAIRVIDQDLYDNGELPVEVETSNFQTGTTPSYWWNNLRGTRSYDFTDYGKYSVTIRMGTCESLPADTLYIKRLGTVTVSANVQEYDGTPKSVTVATNPPSLPVRVTYNGSDAPPVQLGTYRVVAEIEDAGYKGKQVSTLTVVRDISTNTPEMADVSVMVYPNPADDILHIDGLCSLFANQFITIELMNFSGVIYIRKQTQDANVSLDMSNIPQGMYLLRITTPKQTVVRKVVKY